MPLILFSFSFNPETKEGALAGNCDPQMALSILTQLCIAEGIKRAQESEAKKAIDNERVD